MNLQIFAGISFVVAAYASAAHAVTTYVNGSPGLGSQYGLIQNVQNYSSNPFWDPNGPYNQRMPTPVYVQGADLNTGDCRRTVGALVGTYCMQHNNCVGMQLSDARPDLMVQLSQLPGHNYASSCAGYIDSEFNSYVSKYANAGPASGGAAFPTPTVPNNALDSGNDFKIQNPYAPKTPSWAKEVMERKQELENLQSMNGGGNVGLARADFPTTAADLTFEQRMQNKAAGYEPFKESSAYKPIKIESEEEYLARLEKKQALSASASKTSNSQANNRQDSQTGTAPTDTNGGGQSGGPSSGENTGAGAKNGVEYACVSNAAKKSKVVNAVRDAAKKMNLDVTSATEADFNNLFADRASRVSVLSELGDAVRDTCISELVNIIEKKSDINVPVELSGKTAVLNVDLDELFQYIKIYSAIVVSDNRSLTPGATLKNSGGAKYWTKECSPHTVWYNLDDDAGVNKAGAAVFSQFGGADNEYFLDFPRGDNQRLFTGMVLIDKTWSTEEGAVVFSNLKSAVETAAAFANALNGGKCASGSNRLAVYLVKMPDSITDVMARAEDRGSTNDWLLPWFGIGWFRSVFASKMGDIDSVTVLTSPYIVR